MVFDGQSWTNFPDYWPSQILVIDKTGVIWGGGKGRIFKFDGNIRTDYDVPSYNIYAATVDQAGHKWFGTDEGVTIFDDQAWKSYTIADGLSGPEVKAIAIDEATGAKWFGALNGVSQFIPHP